MGFFLSTITEAPRKENTEEPMSQEGKQKTAIKIISIMSCRKIEGLENRIALLRVSQATRRKELGEERKFLSMLKNRYRNVIRMDAQ